MCEWAVFVGGSQNFVYPCYIPNAGPSAHCLVTALRASLYTAHIKFSFQFSLNSQHFWDPDIFYKNPYTGLYPEPGESSLFVLTIYL
jgi:hypothetical protein